MDGASLERAFAARFNQMDILEENSRNHMEEIRKIKEVQNITLNKVAIVKYDAFKEMGGKLSFALAMLDKENNGFVMNAIHSSDGCYTYVKEIVKGESYVVLARRRGSSPPGRELPQRTGAVKTLKRPENKQKRCFTRTEK